jgi:hypothetical protein
MTVLFVGKRKLELWGVGVRLGILNDLTLCQKKMKK